MMQKADRRIGFWRLGPGLSATALKSIGILAMLCDHVACLFVPASSMLYLWMRFFGRITAPVMFYFLAEGVRRTRNVNRYTCRIAAFALLSYLPFIYFDTGGLPRPGHFTPLGVGYTLLLALLAIRARHRLQNPFAAGLMVLGLVLLSLPGDWAIFGVVIPLLFDHFYGDYRRQCLAVGVVVLLSATPLFVAGSAGIFIQLGQLLPLLLLGFYNGRRGGAGRVGCLRDTDAPAAAGAKPAGMAAAPGFWRRAGAFLAKWGFYLFYPAHLVVLGLLRNWAMGWPLLVGM